MLDVLVQPRRDKVAAERLLRKLLRKQMRPPRVMITDKLPSYGAAKKGLLPGVEHRHHESRAEPSWLAGRIVGWHSEPDEKGKSKTVFTFVQDDGLCRVQADWGGGREKAYVGLDTARQRAGKFRLSDPVVTIGPPEPTS